VEDGVLTASPVEDKRQQAGELCGDYVLRTDRELGAAQVWSLYMTLLQAEEGYACLKGSLGLRPNFHQTGQRVEAHIFISVLGYHLLCWVRERLREKRGQPRLENPAPPALHPQPGHHRASPGGRARAARAQTQCSGPGAGAGLQAAWH
jgi:hypothetical protein